MIFESFGGVSGEAERNIKSLNKAVAENTDTSEAEVATLLWQRVAIDIQRSGHRALVRRLKQRGQEHGNQLVANLGLGGLFRASEQVATHPRSHSPHTMAYLPFLWSGVAQSGG